MQNSANHDEVTELISNILNEQLKMLHTNSSEFQVLLDEQKIDEVFLKSILPIYKVLKTLRTENKINAAEFNLRIDSLINILHLLGELTDQNSK